MLKAMQNNLSAAVGRVTGNLDKSLGWKKLGREGMMLGIGARKFGAWTGFHAHLVEFGTEERITESGASKGRMPVMKWFKPAVDSTKQKAVDDFRAERMNAMAAFIRRANKKKKR